MALPGWLTFSHGPPGLGSIAILAVLFLPRTAAGKYALLMIQMVWVVSIRDWLLGSQVSKARRGAPFGLFANDKSYRAEMGRLI
jgi:hypothetical protein